MKHYTSIDARLQNALNARSSFSTVLFLLTMIVCSTVSQTARAEYAFQLLYEFPSSGTGPKHSGWRLVQGDDDSFYGMSTYGGSNGFGAVFKIASTGVMTPLASFSGTNGRYPIGGLLVASDGMLYGTTQYGGTNGGPYGLGYGTVFRITTNGVLTNLFSFNRTNGSLPNGSLVQGSDGNFYGTTGTTGEPQDGLGTIFRITPDGSLTTLAFFRGTNGSNPTAGLIQGNDGDFYGTTAFGGINWPEFNRPYGGGKGTVFKVTTNGQVTPLVFFNITNGWAPLAGLTLANDGNYYGTTASGGTFTNGTVFKMTSDGTLITLVSFDGTNGSRPNLGVAQGTDGKLYGVTALGSQNTNSTLLGEFGTVYDVTTNGELTIIERFNGTNVQNPFAELSLARDGNLYGVAGDQSSQPSLDGNAGIFFRLVQMPQITSLTRSNSSVELTWSSFTNGMYRVEYNSSLSAPNWSPLAPDVTATNDTSSFVDSPVGDAERYYRVRLLP